jgi:hypothetical protein
MVSPAWTNITRPIDKLGDDKKKQAVQPAFQGSKGTSNHLVTRDIPHLPCSGQRKQGVL